MKYNDRDCKPLESLATKDLVQLEHKYRLLLKESGFDDIEAWDNHPKNETKQIKFIKGHLRYRGKSIKDFSRDSLYKTEFFRIIGLYSHHFPKLPEKYRTILQDYSLTGNMSESIRRTQSEVNRNTLGHYIKAHLTEMITFVKDNFKESEDQYEYYFDKALES